MGADIDLVMARREAERRMREIVTIGELEQRAIPGSLATEAELSNVVYTGKARVKFPSASAYVPSPAGQQIAQTNIVLSVPSGTPIIPTGSVVRVESSKDDEVLVGRLLRVKGPAQAGQTTAHRYPVVEES